MKKSLGKNYREILFSLKEMDNEEQRKYGKEKLKAFKQLWDSNPDEETFAFYANGLLLDAEMLYYMVKSSGEHEDIIGAPIKAVKGIEGYVEVR